MRFCYCSHHYGGEVFTLKATDGVVQRLVHGCRNPLSDQAVEVDGATEELQNAQAKKSLESRDVEDDTAVTLRNGKKT